MFTITFVAPFDIGYTGFSFAGFGEIDYIRILLERCSHTEFYGATYSLSEKNIF